MITSRYISVLLTYKNKVLLYARDLNDPNNHKISPWSLFIWQEEKDIHSLNTVHKIRQLTSLSLDEGELLSNEDESTLNYHYKLSDLQVNHMHRKNGQLLQFYTLSELQKLSLTPLTSTFFDQYQVLIKNIISK